MTKSLKNKPSKHGENDNEIDAGIEMSEAKTKKSVKTAKSIKSVKSTKPAKASKSTKTAKAKTTKKVVNDSDNDSEVDVDDIDTDEDDYTEGKIFNKTSKKSTKNESIQGKGKKKSSKNDITDTMPSSRSKSKKDNKILEIKTTHTGALKQVFERISNFISDCCIVFIPPDENCQNEDDDDFYEEIDDSVSHSRLKSKPKPSKTTKKNTGGIRIHRLTEDKNIYVKLELDADNFDYFRCDEPKITIGVDMHNLHALLKTINDDDPIILYMNRDNRGALYIRSLNENEESSEETDIEIFLIEIPSSEMRMEQTKFQNKITMASDKFHTICKHLNNNSAMVEITSVNNEILFRGQSDGGKVTMSYRDTDYGKKKKTRSDQVVQGVYELKNLLGFSKCNKLCPTIDIYLKNDFPLVLVITVATLGKMYVFLTPIDNGNN